jgi:CHAD domain-containing protein/CYTH domain-containing protein
MFRRLMTDDTFAVVHRPAAPGIRLLALRLLDQAEDARLRLREGSDPEALHDFRVAIRRLRSTLRSYAPQLVDSVGKRDGKRLRSLARNTSESRDREVQLEMLDRIRTEDEVESAAIAWLHARVEGLKADADVRVHDVVEQRFPRIRNRLTERLAHYRGTVNSARPDAREPFLGEVAAGALTVLGATLEARLAGLRDVQQQAGAHRTRIAGKRVRYTLEPFRPELPLAAKVVTRLKRLQDDLGDMHDLHVFGQEIGALIDAPPPEDASRPDAGLLLLRERMRRDRNDRFDAIRSAWSGPEGAALFHDLRTIVWQLRERASDGLEIERKFLLRGMPSLRRRGARSIAIDQGWIPGDALQERLRREREGDSTRYLRTVKTGRGVVRTELEEETTKELWQRMWRLTSGHRVRKRRYTFEHEGLTWCIDRFLDRTLVLAEVELPAPDTPVEVPRWLHKWIDREVTGEDAYVNVNLAMQSGIVAARPPGAR